MTTGKNISARLLEFCLMAGGLEDVVRVLELLSKPHTYERQSHFSRLNDGSKVFVIGIRQVASATAIARAVDRHGWVNCGALIMEMLTEDRVVDYGEHFALLALEFYKLGNESAALLVAKRTLELTYFACSNLSEQKAEIVVNLSEMIFCIKGCIDEVGLGFVERLGELTTNISCRLIVVIHTEAVPIFLKSLSCSDLSEDAIQQASSRQAVLLRKVCQHVTTRDFHRPDISQAHVVNLVETFFELGDEQLFNTLIEAFLHRSRVHKEQHLLKKLLNSDSIWTDLSGTVVGRSKWRLLSAERILERKQPDPPLTWCMPSAKYHGDPAIKTFLTGPDESFTFTKVYGSVEEAKNFGKTYFDGRYVNGYSALAEVTGQGSDVSEEEDSQEARIGRFWLGSKVTVVIRKTCTAFESDLAHRKEKELRELSRLRGRIGKLNSLQAVAAGIVPGSAGERADVPVSQKLVAM